MNTTKIIDSAMKAVRLYGAKGLFYGKKYAPEILTGVGIVGGVTAAVMVGKATLKLEPVINRLEVDLAVARNLRAEFTEEERSKMEHLRALGQAYVVAALRIAEIYAPAIGVGSMSVLCVVGAHGIMRRRTVALVAAYEALERGFSTYRQRVIEEFGEEKDSDYRYGVTDGKVHVRTDDATGEKHRVTEAMAGGEMPSPYARVFDEVSPNWDKRAEYNLMFLNAQQKYMNQKLTADGFLFLNDVYDALGLPRTSAGQIVGWLMPKKTEEELGDMFVDFGIYNMANTKSREFVNGRDKYILLDFNVDGVIYDKI